MKFLEDNGYKAIISLKSIRLYLLIFGYVDFKRFILCNNTLTIFGNCPSQNKRSSLVSINNIPPNYRVRTIASRISVDKVRFHIIDYYACSKARLSKRTLQKADSINFSELSAVTLNSPQWQRWEIVFAIFIAWFF